MKITAVLVCMASMVLAQAAYSAEVNPFERYAGNYRVTKATCGDGRIQTVRMTCDSVEGFCDLEFRQDDGREWQAPDSRLEERHESDDGFSISQKLSETDDGALMEGSSLSPSSMRYFSVSMSSLDSVTYVIELSSTLKSLWSPGPIACTFQLKKI
jgi:hypothetical protein